MRFGRQHRVRMARDFESAKKNAAKVDCSAFVFYLSESQSKFPRLGVITSRKIGNAVERNTARRRVRAIFRSVAPSLDGGRDILIFVRRGFFKFGYDALGAKFRYGVARASKILFSRKNAKNVDAYSIQSKSEVDGGALRTSGNISEVDAHSSVPMSQNTNEKDLK